MKRKQSKNSTILDGEIIQFKEFKIVIVGELAVGKSSIVQRIVKDEYSSLYEVSLN